MITLNGEIHIPPPHSFIFWITIEALSSPTLIVILPNKLLELSIFKLVSLASKYTIVKFCSIPIIIGKFIHFGNLAKDIFILCLLSKLLVIDCIIVVLLFNIKYFNFYI